MSGTESRTAISFFQEVNSKILCTCTMQLGVEGWVREDTERVGTGLKELYNSPHMLGAPTASRVLLSQ